MSEFDLLILRGEFAADISDQFNFWMATTFAVVIASHTAGERLSLKFRAAVALLYSVACVVFFLRYLAAAHDVAVVVQMLRDLDSDFLTQYVNEVGVARQFVMIGGSVLAILLMLRPSITRTIDADDQDT